MAPQRKVLPSAEVYGGHDMVDSVYQNGRSVRSGGNDSRFTGSDHDQEDDPVERPIQGRLGAIEARDGLQRHRPDRSDRAPVGPRGVPATGRGDRAGASDPDRTRLAPVTTKAAPRRERREGTGQIGADGPYVLSHPSGMIGAMASADAGAAVHNTLRRVELAVLLAGLVLRVQSMLTRELAQDGWGYLDYAERWSLLEPWATDDREPLWVAVVKIVAGPFGYSPRALQVLGLVCSVGVLWLGWKLLGLVAGGWPRVAGFAFLAFHPLLVADVGNGIREPLATLLFAGALWSIATRRPYAAGLLVGVCWCIRWELGLVLAVLLAVGCWRWTWRPLAAVAVVMVVVMGPFLARNANIHDDPLYHSNIHARYFRNIEDGYNQGLDPYKLPRFRGEHITWGDYYLDYLGPNEAAHRFSAGFSRVPAEVVSYERGGLLGLAGLAVAGVGLWRHRRSRVIIGAGLLILGGTIGFAGIWQFMSYRVVSYLALPLAVLLVAAVTRPEGSSGNTGDVVFDHVGDSDRR